MEPRGGNRQQMTRRVGIGTGFLVGVLLVLAAMASPTVQAQGGEIQQRSRQQTLRFLKA